MGLKLEKRCSVGELQIGKRYAIGNCGKYPLIVSSINYDRGYVLLKYIDDTREGLIYLNTPFYFYEFPLTSLEKELL